MLDKHFIDVHSLLGANSSYELPTTARMADDAVNMLDAEMLADPSKTYLCLASKTGMIAKRLAYALNDALKDAIPDPAERLHHIFHRQIYVWATSEAAAWTTARTLYETGSLTSESCPYRFANPLGNVRWHSKSSDPSEQVFGFLDDSCDLVKEFGVRFSAVLSNPPYHVNTEAVARNGGRNKRGLKAIYPDFFLKAKRLNADVMVFILPDRFFSSDVKKLQRFCYELCAGDHVEKVVDYVEATAVFPKSNIKGGICCIKWNRRHSGGCPFISRSRFDSFADHEMYREKLYDSEIGAVIRWNGSLGIIEKVKAKADLGFMSDLVSKANPYGLNTNVKEKHPELACAEGDVEVYAHNGSVFRMQSKHLPKKPPMLGETKIFVPAAYVTYNFPPRILGTPVVVGPGCACTQTFLQIGPFTPEEAENAAAYLKTKFAAFMAMLLKPTQHMTWRTYRLMPVADFSIRWTDEMLYRHFGLSEEEIQFIESMVRGV